MPVVVHLFGQVRGLLGPKFTERRMRRYEYFRRIGFNSSRSCACFILYSLVNFASTFYREQSRLLNGPQMVLYLLLELRMGKFFSTIALAIIGSDRRLINTLIRLLVWIFRLTACTCVPTVVVLNAALSMLQVVC